MKVKKTHSKTCFIKSLRKREILFPKTFWLLSFCTINWQITWEKLGSVIIINFLGLQYVARTSWGRGAWSDYSYIQGILSAGVTFTGVSLANAFNCHFINLPQFNCSEIVCENITCTNKESIFFMSSNRFWDFYSFLWN